MTNVWAQRGTRPVQTKQSEYDWVYLYGAANPLTGDSVALIAPTVNTELMGKYLGMISQHLDPDVQVVLVMDNAGWHVAKKLKIPNNITPLFLPPYSPELNPMERLWCWIKTHQLSNQIFEDYEALLDSSCKAWNSLTPKLIQSICHTSWLEHTI